MSNYPGSTSTEVFLTKTLNYSYSFTVFLMLITALLAILLSYFNTTHTLRKKIFLFSYSNDLQDLRPTSALIQSKPN